MIEKEAALPLSARIAIALLGAGGLELHNRHEAELIEEAKRLNEAERQAEHERMADTLNALGKTASAKYAMESGRLLAQSSYGMSKEAIGIPSVLKPGWKTKALLTGGVLAGSYGAYKGIGAAGSYLERPRETVQWGAKPPLQTNISEQGYPSY